jgi:flagellar biosynthesis/type III secretory pathway protein FliH
VAEDTFVSLADLLRPPSESPALDTPIVTLDPGASPNDRDDRDDRDAAALAALARDVRVFHAQLRDAFDASLDVLLRECAYAILGRELQLADCDIAAIVARTIASHRDAQPLRVRVAPGDLERCRADASLPPCIGDAMLAPGDAIVELASGAIDARLGVRLTALFERAS